jgi:hypothetical protein
MSALRSTSVHEDANSERPHIHAVQLRFDSRVGSVPFFNRVIPGTPPHDWHREVLKENV